MSDEDWSEENIEWEEIDIEGSSTAGVPKTAPKNAPSQQSGRTSTKVSYSVQTKREPPKNFSKVTQSQQTSQHKAPTTHVHFTGNQGTQFTKVTGVPQTTKVTQTTKFTGAPQTTVVTQTTKVIEVPQTNGVTQTTKRSSVAAIAMNFNAISQAPRVSYNKTVQQPNKVITKPEPQVVNHTFLSSKRPPSQVEDVPLPSKEEIIKHCLSAHNKWRKEVGSPPLEWSEELARSSQEVADKCASNGFLQHSARGGENLWGGGNKKVYNVTDMINKWSEEIKFFNPNPPRKFPNISKTGNWMDCGHYTQLVWKDSKKVGAALARGKNGFVVLCCHYDPNGNIRNESVY